MPVVGGPNPGTGATGRVREPLEKGFPGSLCLTQWAGSGQAVGLVDLKAGAAPPAQWMRSVLLATQACLSCGRQQPIDICHFPSFPGAAFTLLTSLAFNPIQLPRDQTQPISKSGMCCSSKLCHGLRRIRSKGLR